MEFNVEKIISLEPDLFLLMDQLQWEAAAGLQQFVMRHYSSCCQ